MANVVIIGGGPGGYEAAMVATQLGGHVTLIERDGVGGAAVLTDVVPSKSLIATAEVMIRVRHSRELGIVPVDPSLNHPREAIKVDLAEIKRAESPRPSASSRSAVSSSITTSRVHSLKVFS